MTRIYLFRHAEAEGNIKREFHGQTEGLITPRGRLQLDALAHRCGELPIERIYSSPLIRAVETAKAVNRLKGVDIVLRNSLMEIHAGVWERMKFQDFPIRYPAENDLWENHPEEFVVEGGESMRQVYGRIRDAVLRIVEENPGRTLGLVSHGCALRNLLCFCKGYPIERLNEVNWIPNTGISCVDFEGTTPHLLFEGDDSHLKDIGSMMMWDDEPSEASFDKAENKPIGKEP